MPYILDDAAEPERNLTTARRRAAFRQIHSRRHSKAPPDRSEKAYQSACYELNNGHPELALHVIDGCPDNYVDIQLRNAKGVCYLRLGKAELAVAHYRPFVLTSFLALKGDVPDPVKRNFAAALLLSGRVAGCLDVLKDVGDQTAPMTQILRSAVDRWTKDLSWRERLMWAMGAQPSHPVPADFVPGELL